jgi:hypothetical protein
LGRQLIQYFVPREKTVQMTAKTALWKMAELLLSRAGELKYAAPLEIGIFVDKENRLHTFTAMSDNSEWQLFTMLAVRYFKERPTVRGKIAAIALTLEILGMRPAAALRTAKRHASPDFWKRNSP